MTNELPAGWTKCKLGDVCGPPQYGWTTKASREPPSRAIKLLRTTDITRGAIQWDGVPYCTELPPDLEKYRISGGDILISRAGSVGVSTLLDGALPPAVFASYLIRFRPGAEVNQKYIAWYLKSDGYWRQIADSTSGIALPNVNARKLAAVDMPLAPRLEQDRIVAAIETIFSHLDAGIESLDRTYRNLRRIRKSILLSVTPKPVPHHWQTVRVADAGSVQLGRQRAPKFHSGLHMRPYLRVANVFEDRIDLSDVKTMDFPPDHFEKYRLQPGDILLNEGQTPDLVGRPAMYRGELPGACFTNSLIRFRPRPEIDGEYALLIFRRHLHAGRFKKESQITTNIAHMAASRFKDVEFPFPPIDDQRAIVASIHRQLSVVRALKIASTEGSKRGSALRRSVLTAAFAGRLVPQEPADEPASLLVERFAASSDALTTAGRRSALVGGQG